MTEWHSDTRRDSKGNLKVITENLNTTTIGRSTLESRNDITPSSSIPMEDSASSTDDLWSYERSSPRSFVSPHSRKALRSSIQPLPTPAIDHMPAAFPTDDKTTSQATYSLPLTPPVSFSRQNTLGSLVLPKRNNRLPTDSASSTRIATEYRIGRTGSSSNEDAAALAAPRNVSLELPHSARESNQSMLRREAGHKLKIELDATDYKLLDSGPFEEVEMDNHSARIYRSILPDRKDGTWLILNKAGAGAFSTVYVGHRLEDDAGTPGMVAVKYVNYSNAAGGSPDRVQLSVEREVECLKAVQHPCLTSLLACDLKPGFAVLVMPFCSGGDMFDLVSNHAHNLSASLVKRFFAEISSAVFHLHNHHFVHRDLKLENILLTLPYDMLPKFDELPAFPHPLVSVTDLGLSKSFDPIEPLLITRCGSEDYSAPEVLMGQTYDGRQTDAWSIGVMLYATLEGRLPFDPPANMHHLGHRPKGRTAHRIARCDYKWYKHAAIRESRDENAKFERIGGPWAGAKKIVEGLLIRRDQRMSVGDILEHDWVRFGIDIDITTLRA